MAQVSKATAAASADLVRLETVAGANTATRVGGHLRDMVDSALHYQDLPWKADCRLATAAALPAYTRTGNAITANANGAAANVDGVAPAVGNRLLLQHGAAGADNGIWTYTSIGSAGSPFTLTRALDAALDADFANGCIVRVREGTANGGKLWHLTTLGAIVVNTTALAFAQLGGGGGGGLANGTAAGQQPLWDGAAFIYLGLLTGTNLTDANQTLQFGTAAQYILPAATLTATRTKTLGTTGATTGATLTIYRLDTTANTMPIVNGGTGGGTIFTFPVSTRAVASFRYDGAAWSLSGWAPLSTPGP